MTKADDFKKKLEKAERYCLKAERCVSDLKRKFWDWKITDKSQQEELISKLLETQFIDEERYALAFARDKFRFNGWGFRRIKDELSMKSISTATINETLNELREEFDEKEQLIQLLDKKYKTLPQGLERQKAYDRLMRYALSRGYSYEQAGSIVNRLIKDYQSITN